MTYQIEKRVKIDYGMQWRAVRPSGHCPACKQDMPPYSYDTRAEAESLVRLCYDGDASAVRVVKRCAS